MTERPSVPAGAPEDLAGDSGRGRDATGRPPVHYGDPAAEHAALLESAGVLDDSDRRIVRVRGERSRRMVSGLVSNDLAPLDRQRAVYTFFLTPKGRPLAEARVLLAGEEPGGEELWLDVPPACLESLLDHLRKYLPPIYARFELHPAARRLGVVGPSSDAVLDRVARELGWPDASALPAPAPLSAIGPPGETAPPGGTDPEAGGLPRLVRREEVEGPGWDIYLPASGVAAAWRALAEAARAEGGRPAGRRAWNVLRVERGVPAYGAEIDLDVLPQETGQEGRAVSVEKGCYTGQEVVARIHYRGKVNRLLRGLAFESRDEPLPSGTELYREGRRAGRVATAVRSPRFGPIALGYVRREASPGERLSISPDGPEEVRVEALPFTDR